MENFITDNFSTQLENIVSTYSSDTIFILGKGPSADNIIPEVCANSLVIGLNDAERIFPVDITLFNKEWVHDAIKESGYRSQMYISPTDFVANGKTVVKAPYVPLTQDSSDLLMQRFLGDKFYIEDVLFLSALKICLEIAKKRGKKQTIYMIGFDFDLSLGQSAKIKKDFVPYLREQDGFIKISAQEFYFMNALYFLKDSLIDVKHVGSRAFSSLSSEDLNSMLINRSVNSSTTNQVAIVAELTTNHFGDRSRLERMIRSSKAAGANYIKLQKRDVEGFYTKEQLSSPFVSPFGKTFGDYRLQLELSFEDFEFVDQLCKSLNIEWFTSVLDFKSFEFMLQFEPNLIKLPSTISEHLDFLEIVGRNYQKGLVLSTGMTDQKYEEFVLKNFDNCEKLFLLQCNSAYPTPLHDCHISVVRHYHEVSKKNPKIIPGYSSHDIGWEASALAVAAGARMLEKHVKLGNTEWAHFDAVAIDLTTNNFHTYVNKIRETEVILGSEIKQVTTSEHHKYRKIKKPNSTQHKVI